MTKQSTDPGSSSDVFSQAKDQATELGKKLASESTVFIKNNPWLAVLGAAVIGFLLGSTRGERK